MRALEKTDVSSLQSTGWKFAQSFQGKAADGTTDLYGLIWKPSNFDPAKKYPVVEHVYTGPTAFRAENIWRQPALAIHGGAGIHCRDDRWTRHNWKVEGVSLVFL